MMTVWDYPSAVPLLRKLWIEGVACLAISKEISKKTGFKITRNAVIGKAHRLRLNVDYPRPSGVANIGNQTGMSRKKAAQKLKAKRVVGVDFVPDAGTAARQKAARTNGQALVVRVEAGAGVVSLNARPFAQSSGCRWVLAGGLVCCNPLGGKVYCAGHDAVAHARTPTQSDERTAAVAASLTRFDGVVDLTKPAPVEAKTGWDAARLAA